MDDLASGPWYAEPDDLEDLFSAEEGDPAVSAAIIAVAVLVIACTVFIVSGLPARLHATAVHSPVTAVSRPALQPVSHRYF